MTSIEISLVVATRGRTSELKRLLDSLVAQTYPAFEVIVVDQNEDDRLDVVVRPFMARLSLQHVRSETRGKAAANNVGLRLCVGKIITFPDDDCWYPADLLGRIAVKFASHPEWNGITGRETASREVTENHRFDTEAGRVTRGNIWRRHISFTLFLRASDVAGLLYDERLGIGAGTVWGSGEETEYLLQVMRRGLYVQFDPTIVVHHPDFGRGPYTRAAITKARRYGMGMGRILQTHSFSGAFTLKSFARPLFGGAYTLMLGKPRKAVYHWAIFVGRFTGWLVSLFAGLRQSESRSSWQSAE